MDSVKNTTEIRFIHAMSWLTSAIAIIIGVVGVLNTMIMSVAGGLARLASCGRSAGRRFASCG